MYIDNTYFSGELSIPNSQSYPNSNLDGNKVSLSQFIGEYEVELMTYALGYDLYSEFVLAFDSEGKLKQAAEQRWKDFVNGKEYEIDGKKFKWKGLRYIEGVIKKSLIADYVYCKYLENYQVSFGGVGTQTENAKNATKVSPIPRIVNTWNGFLSKYQGEQGGNYPKVVSTTYGSTVGVDWMMQRYAGTVSMYQYLADHEVDFPNLEMGLFKAMNTFGL